MNRVVFEPHAVERFIERHMPGVTMAHAHRILRSAVPTARRLRERTRSGDECWMIAEYNAVLVITREGREGERARCITVLPKGAHQGYVHERRTARAPVADPTHEALTTAVRYVVANANRGEERALRVVDELQRIAPWVLTGIDVARAEGENENALSHDSDASESDAAHLSNEKSHGGSA